MNPQKHKWMGTNFPQPQDLQGVGEEEDETVDGIR